MQIFYEQNPLSTKIILNDHERTDLWWKIKVDILEDLLFDAHYNLSKPKDGSFEGMGRTQEERMEAALKSLNPDYYLGSEHANEDNKTPIDVRTDLVFNWLIEELQNDHVGDCTCVPCACNKCMAEDKIGTNTTKGLGSHPANMIAAAFKKHKTLDEVIDYLNQDATPEWGTLVDWVEHLPRWNKERQEAVTWLTNYKDQHFKGE